LEDIAVDGASVDLTSLGLFRALLPAAAERPLSAEAAEEVMPEEAARTDFDSLSGLLLLADPAYASPDDAAVALGAVAPPSVTPPKSCAADDLIVVFTERDDLASPDLGSPKEVSVMSVAVGGYWEDMAAIAGGALSGDVPRLLFGEGDSV